jgi:transposase
MKTYGLCRTTIYPWLRRHKKGGEAALQSRPSTGRPPTLSDKEKLQVRRWICGNAPMRMPASSSRSNWIAEYKVAARSPDLRAFCELPSGRCSKKERSREKITLDTAAPYKVIE